jgi:hypothetical protein
MNIVEAIHDPKLFRPCFQDLATWEAWFVAAKALFGLQMNRHERRLFQKYTGRTQQPEKAFKEFWAIIGRRGGKSYIAAVIACYLALFHNYRQYLSPGERGVIQIVAVDRYQAQVIFRYIVAILHSNPVFAQYIQNETKEIIELTNAVDIEVMACSFRSIRGRTVVAFIADEVAFWRIEGANPDKEIFAAVRPGMATIPNSIILVLSSPYARMGELYNIHHEFFGTDNPDVLVWHAPTEAMNPTIDKKVIERDRKRDPVSASSEWDAEFRSDIETYIAREAVEQCIIRGRIELPSVVGVHYSAFVDPSGGSQDSFTLAISHVEGDKKVLDALREVRPPFSPDSVVREFATLLKAYRCSTITGDHYAGLWPRERFAVHGIRYEVSSLPKSDMYLNLLPLLNSGQVELLDNDRLVSQIVGLERRTGRGGKDSIDHGPGGHDDIANVAAGVLVGDVKQGVTPRISVVSQGASSEEHPEKPVCKPGEILIPIYEDGDKPVAWEKVYRPRRRGIFIPGLR